MDFGKLEINENAKGKLSAALAGGQFSHAVLLTGKSDDIRKKTARRIAAALLCTAQTGQKPCGVCPACVKSKANTHPDIIEIEGSDKSKSIKIDTVRELRGQAFIIPNEGDCKVFLILEASGMGEEAQNALLKLIEEPPRFTRFVLACASKELLLPTIQSRVTTYFLGEGGRDKTTAKTAEKLSATATEIIAAMAGGSEYDLIVSTAPLEKDRALFKKCVGELMGILRDALRHEDGGEPLSENPAAASLAANALSKKELLGHYESLRLLAEDAEKNANENLLLARLAAALSK
ncbi:MAG: hypothetical protein LBS36_00450 [Oscillospiraceae bacterium]|jgi:DNA polymerase-3 subunit delta'|nr:hypothetical protein [Oscillospiraceae bacterium]